MDPERLARIETIEREARATAEGLGLRGPVRDHAARARAAEAIAERLLGRFPDEGEAFLRGVALNQVSPRRRRRKSSGASGASSSARWLLLGWGAALALLAMALIYTRC